MVEDSFRDVDPAFEQVVGLLHTHPYFHSFSLLRQHASLLLLLNSENEKVWVSRADAWDHLEEQVHPFIDSTAERRLSVILLGGSRGVDLQTTGRSVLSVLPKTPSPEELFFALQTGFYIQKIQEQAESRGRHLRRYRYELNELIEISKALTTEHEIDKLLALILEKSRLISGADAGSIYVVEGSDPEIARRALRFKLSQNQSMQFDAREFTIPINPKSIAGSAVIHRKSINIADVYSISSELNFGFDPSIDQRTGYRTRSMLTTPLINHRGEVTGVLQLINKKRNPKVCLEGIDDVEEQVIPFDERSEELLATLASHAAIALENALLYAEITTLFDGFVKASVSAIEQRDPTTSGHSRRVADLTVALAHAMKMESSGVFGDVSWTPQEMREIEYASLLHDFGKIGVREQVLVKAKKLYPGQIEAIRLRIDLAIRAAETEALRCRLNALEYGASREEMDAIEATFVTRREDLEAMWKILVAANEPTVLREGDFARIEAIAREMYVNLQGVLQPLITQEELRCLCVSRGSLTDTEMDEIRGHVVHTRNFLDTIPWGSVFRRIPLIAGAHHERLDGTGYPNHWVAEQIPLQSKMMSISDIFDALTASDRPYKRAVPLERALDILQMEVNDSHLDGDLFRIFREAHVWKCLR